MRSLSENLPTNFCYPSGCSYSFLSHELVGVWVVAPAVL